MFHFIIFTLTQTIFTQTMSTLDKSSIKSGKRRKDSQSRSSRAGLQFPVGRVSRYLRRSRCAKRLGEGAAVCAAALLEYLTAEILELAGNACKDLKKKRIVPRHLMLAIRGDDELNALMDRVTIPGGGVIPHIHKSLIVRKKKSDTDGHAATKKQPKVVKDEIVSDPVV